MKTFLLSYSAAVSPESVQTLLNTTRAVSTWVAPFPYSAIVISELTLNELTAVFELHLSGSWFLLTELSATSSNGLMPHQLWTYVQEPWKAWSEKILAELQRRSHEMPSLPPRPDYAEPPDAAASAGQSSRTR